MAVCTPLFLADSSLIEVRQVSIAKLRNVSILRSSARMHVASEPERGKAGKRNWVKSFLHRREILEAHIRKFQEFFLLSMRVAFPPVATH